MEFKEKVLENIDIEIIDGDRGKNYPNGDDFKKEKYCLFLNAKNVTYSGFEFSENMFISREKDDILRKGKLKRNDIVLTTRGTVGNVGFYSNDIKYDNIRINSGMVIIRNNDFMNINNKYIYWYLKSPKIQGQIMKIKTGSAQPQLPISILKKLKIILPDKKIQDKITKILDNIEQKIKLNNQINNNLQELCNNVFIKWFCNYDYPDINSNPYKISGGKMVASELGEIPEKWRIGLFQDIIEFSNGYSFKSSDLLDEEEKETYKVFKQGNINLSGGINEEKTKSWFYKEKAKGLEKFILKKGDILMCMTDMKNSTSPLLGHTALMNIDDEYIVNQRVGLIRCKKEITDYPYVYTMSNLEYFLKDIGRRANSGVQVNLSIRGICETKIVIPSKYVLDKYNNFAKPLYEIMFNKQKENSNLEQLRDTLLPKLMNGEIDLENVEI